ncbi:ferritin-like domain-containing protein [Oxynema aestuarii]|nr:DUF2202 domain-containing protein [Oxynema aestuarii]
MKPMRSPNASSLFQLKIYPDKPMPHCRNQHHSRQNRGQNRGQNCGRNRGQSLGQFAACTGAIAALTLNTTAVSQAAIIPSDRTVQAMIEGIEDEYKARALYQAVIDKFGEIRPFTNIVIAEDRHAKMWEPLFQKYGVPLPEDRYANNIEAPATLKEACEMGVQGEIDNVEMYDRFLNFVEEPDIRSVFLRLRNISEERHLPAFQRCLQRVSR